MIYGALIVITGVLLLILNILEKILKEMKEGKTNDRN